MIEPSPIPGASLAGARDEAKAYLRIEHDAEDALLDRLLAEAVVMAEAFTAQMLISRDVVEVRSAGSGWQRLSATPVRAITMVQGLPVDGAPFVLPVGDYAIDIDSNADGWLRVANPGAAGRVRMLLVAGLAPDWAGLPEPLRLGILRLAAHSHAHRDAADDAGPPAAVAALLRPWRRMRLS
jgi:uncharacterized phiE125 gp8 family phage protein